MPYVTALRGDGTVIATSELPSMQWPPIGALLFLLLGMCLFLTVAGVFVFLCLSVRAQQTCLHNLYIPQLIHTKRIFPPPPPPTPHRPPLPASRRYCAAVGVHQVPRLISLSPLPTSLSVCPSLSPPTPPFPFPACLSPCLHACILFLKKCVHL